MTGLKDRYAIISNNLSNVQVPLSGERMVGHAPPGTDVSVFRIDDAAYGFSFRRNEIDYLLRFDAIKGSITLFEKSLPMGLPDTQYTLRAVECKLSPKDLRIFEDALENFRASTNPTPVTRPPKLRLIKS